MAYELHLKADTITELAHLVRGHHEELSVITGQVVAHDVVAQSNQVAAASVLEDGDNFTLPRVAQTFVAREVQPNPATSSVDADGLPWDERIHSSNRKMTARGVWTRRKNVDDAVYNSVVAELRGTPQAPITTAFAAELPQPWTPAPEAVQYPPVPVQPAYVPIAPAPVATYAINDLFIKLQQLFANGQADVAYMNSLNARLAQMYNVQVNTINDVTSRPDMIASAFDLIAQDEVKAQGGKLV